MIDEPAGVGNIIGNVTAVGAASAALIGWLPPLAALIAVVWYMIQIYESETLQNYVRRRTEAKLIRMQAEVIAMQLSLGVKGPTVPHVVLVPAPVPPKPVVEGETPTTVTTTTATTTVAV